jgi:hypothetical protein
MRREIIAEERATLVPKMIELCPIPSRPILRYLGNTQSHIPGSRDKPKVRSRGITTYNIRYLQ